MGHIDIPLNDLGRQQAMNACVTMANMKFKTIFSSLLSRAIETTQLLLRNSNNHFLDYRDEFREINFGHH
jgi:broad specificity phosphatase PhoE